MRILYPARGLATVKVQTPNPADGPAFLCDAMLGSLARWLRFFGYDVLFPQPGPEDRVLAGIARDEGRWLLTRDLDLAAAGPRSMLIRSSTLEDQLAEVFERLGLRPVATLESARCGECNGVLDDVTREEVSETAPPHVLATAPRFRRCGGCGRVYWPGSHSGGIVERMETVVERLS